MYEDEIRVEEENLEDEIGVEEENVVVNTGGTTDHARLRHLDYATSGHTGFASFYELDLELRGDGSEIYAQQKDIDYIYTYKPAVLKINGYFGETLAAVQYLIIIALNNYPGMYEGLISYALYNDTEQKGKITIIQVPKTANTRFSVIELDYATTSELNNKQDTLVSGTNIKTINNTSILGSGNINIEAGGGGVNFISLEAQNNDLDLLDLVTNAQSAETYVLSNDGDVEITVATEGSSEIVIAEKGAIISVYPEYGATILCADGVFVYVLDYQSQDYFTGGAPVDYETVERIVQGYHYVDLQTDQTITGVKNFSIGISFEKNNGTASLGIEANGSGGVITYTSSGGKIPQLKFNGTSTEVNGNLIPRTELPAFDLGTSNKRWNTVYTKNIHNGTNNISTTNIATKTELAGKQDTLTFDSTPTASSTNPVTSGGVYTAIQNVTEIAEGKTATYTLSYATTGNASFNSQDNSITVSSFVDTAGNVITDEDVKVGDIVLIVEVDVPDRWVQSIDTTNHTITFYKMETSKIDLNNYVDLTSAQTISGEKTITNAVPLKFAGTYTGQIINQENQLRFKYGGSDKLKISTSNVTSSAHLIPNNGNTYDLGTSTYKWRNIYVGGNLSDGTNETTIEKINNNFAPIYDATATYAVGDKVIYGGKLYVCNTAITTAEDFDSTHWTEVSVSDGYVDLDTAQTISGVKTFSNGIKTNLVQMASGSGIEFKLGGGSYNMRIQSGTFLMDGDIFPTSDGNRSFGHSGRRYKNLYLSGNLSDGTNSIAVNKIANKDNFVTLSQSDYDDLVDGGTVDSDTFYFIEEE